MAVIRDYLAEGVLYQGQVRTRGFAIADMQELGWAESIIARRAATFDTTGPVYRETQTMEKRPTIARMILSQLFNMIREELTEPWVDAEETFDGSRSLVVRLTPLRDEFGAIAARERLQYEEKAKRSGVDVRQTGANAGRED